MKKEFTGVFRDIIEEMAEIVVVRASLDLEALADDATAIRFQARTNRNLLKALLVDLEESEQICDEINEAVKQFLQSLSKIFEERSTKTEYEIIKDKHGVATDVVANLNKKGETN